jgi:hypothetical protein
MLCRTIILLTVVLGMLLTVAAPSEAEDVAKGEASAQSKSWIFDQGLYTNSQKTGQRVWKYAAPKAAYRDPNAIFDSPHGSYPFQPDVYDPYSHYYPNVYGVPRYPYPYAPPIYGIAPPIILPSPSAP